MYLKSAYVYLHSSLYLNKLKCHRKYEPEKTFRSPDTFAPRLRHLRSEQRIIYQNTRATGKVKMCMLHYRRHV